MQKKGQITIYVVIGVVIIALVVLMISFRERIFVSEWEKERQAAQIVPEKAKSVQKFVLDCIEETGEQAVNIMGLQGGYIEVPENPIPPTPINPLSNALRIFPNQEYKTAFWFYEAANKVQKTIVPEKEDMEKELAEYMDNNLARCTLNFTLFEEFNVTSGPISSKAQILDNRVLFTVSYPIKVEIEDFTFNYPNFYQEVQTSLGKLYEKAKDMLGNMKDDYFLEEFTIDILVVNEDIPFSGTEMSCTPKFWNVADIERELKNDLEKNVAHIKVVGTDFAQKDDYFVWDVLKGSTLLPTSDKNFHVDFRYSQSWPLKIEVFPSDTGVLTAEPFNQPGVEEIAYVSAFLCMLDYNFIYDITYPVLIALSDDDGYVFQFATQVIIDNNQPRKNILGDEDFPEEKPRICREPVTPLTVYALDGSNYAPIDDAMIKIKCVSTVCNLGKTGFDPVLGTTALNVVSPACVNAFLSADKEGYHKGKVMVDTTESGDYNVVMEKYRLLDYQIKIVEESGYVRDPEEGETVIITLFEEEKRHSVTLAPGLKETKVKLIPGFYAFSAQVAAESEEGFYIESKTIDKCIETPKEGFLGAFLSLKEEHCYSAEVPGTTLDQVITGGAKFDWELTGGELDSASKVTFYVPVRSAPKTQEDLLKVQEQIEGSTTVIFPELEE